MPDGAVKAAGLCLSDPATPRFQAGIANVVPDAANRSPMECTMRARTRLIVEFMKTFGGGFLGASHARSRLHLSALRRVA